jgi:hypothetical protein
VARWSEEQYRAYITKHDTPLSEAAFMSAITRLARANQWMVYHTHNSKRSPEGYPDLTLAKPGEPLIFAELKTLTGQLTKPQEAWLATLAATSGIVTALWRPTDLEAIVNLLRKGHNLP